MAGLAKALVLLGHNVTYVAEQGMSADRMKLGWQVPDMQGVKLRFAEDSTAIDVMVREASARSVHLCQGIRGNGKVSRAQRELAKRDLPQWVVMETVDDVGAVGMFKRWEYGRLFHSLGRSLVGVLAIGHTTVDWITARGMPAERIYPFAYFLPDVNLPVPTQKRKSDPFRFLFVGQFIKRKRLDLLINSLQLLIEREFELLVVGSGPLERNLRVLAEGALPDRVRWLGMLPQAEVPQIMSESDCLVLPSRIDGWGAVISEALMAGTPVICSDTCGAAGVVQSSGFGGVFSHNRCDDLQAMLVDQLQSGPINTENRMQLASWATALASKAGARYLINVLDYAAKGGSRPLPPWHFGGN